MGEDWRGSWAFDSLLSMAWGKQTDGRRPLPRWHPASPAMIIGGAAARATWRLLVMVWLSLSALVPHARASFIGSLLGPCLPQRPLKGGGREDGRAADELLERILAARKTVLRKGWKAAVGGGEEALCTCRERQEGKGVHGVVTC